MFGGYCGWWMERFFRWLKTQLRLTRPLGHSENALELSIWLTLIVHLLLVLALHALDLPHRSPLLRCRLADALAALTPAELRGPAPVQLTFPAWVLDARPPPVETELQQPDEDTIRPEAA